MNVRILVLGAIFLCIGCAPYKLLQPKPELSPAEAGYIELKNNKKDFELKKEKKYYIGFPASQEDNFYLVLSVPQKKSLKGDLSHELINKKLPGKAIADESETDTQFVYPIVKGSPSYFFVDGISSDLVFQSTYRYTPQWRFKFENKHASFIETLEKNRVDRAPYQAIGNGSHLDGINYQGSIDTITRNRVNIQNVYTQLLAIESIFPASIVNSQDEAYLNYKKLKSGIEDEMQFDDAYLATLTFLMTEFNSRGNPLELVKAVEAFITFFEGKEKITPAAVAEAKSILSSRLVEIVPFYSQRLKGKNDFKPFEQETYFVKELLRIGDLCFAAGIPPSPDYAALALFVKEYNSRSSALIAAVDSLQKLSIAVAGDAAMPADGYFQGIVKSAKAIYAITPKALDEGLGDYVNYNCAENLNTETGIFTKKIETDLAGYQEAEATVPELNALKARKDYSTMLGILKQKMHLTFLMKKYAPLDKMSVEEQGIQIGEALAQRSWPQSESLLRRLHEDNNFINPAEIMPVKRAVVEDYEDSLYTRIDRYSRARINKFADENFKTVDNVDSLYTDSVFLPAYDVTFSSGSKAELIQRKNALVEHLAKMKDDEFPAKSIELLYKDFLKQPDDNGVFKARAIVTHGKYYKGKDNKIIQRVSECDPTASKWIVEPKTYRRVFATPITSSRKGKNKYMVRFIVNIETEANFPVYDVNIKLPKEIAQNAATEQWYDAITLNKKELKNEGRFTISAPTASNNYECQITPVQMTKGKGNYLEITFTHPSFRVHQISVMVQKPIIKKN